MLLFLEIIGIGLLASVVLTAVYYAIFMALRPWLDAARRLVHGTQVREFVAAPVAPPELVAAPVAPPEQGLPGVIFSQAPRYAVNNRLAHARLSAILESTRRTATDGVFVIKSQGPAIAPTRTDVQVMEVLMGPMSERVKVKLNADAMQYRFSEILVATAGAAEATNFLLQPEHRNPAPPTVPQKEFSLGDLPGIGDLSKEKNYLDSTRCTFAGRA